MGVVPNRKDLKASIKKNQLSPHLKNFLKNKIRLGKYHTFLFMLDS